MDRPPSRRLVTGALGVAALAALTPPAWGQALRRLSAEDEGQVKRVEDYLNTLRTFRSRFLQIDNAGGEARGVFYLWRPGRLRLDYEAPNPNLLISNGQFLIHYDRLLKTPSYLPLSSTPAGLLVREPISLHGDVSVIKIERAAQVMRVTVVRSEDVRAGQVTFVFSEQPFALTNWQVVDPQGQIIRVQLYDAQAGMPLDPELFVFKDPATYGDQGTK